MPAKSKNPRVKLLLNDLRYIDTVEAKRTVYHVFQSDKDYLIFSYRDATYRSGNFNVVASDTMERIRRTFAGRQRITRREIEEHPRIKRFVKDFDVLQALYVLVAAKQATIDGRSPNSKTLYFNIRNTGE